MTTTAFHLSLAPGRFAVCRFAPGEAIPSWATAGAFFSVTRTVEELSVVCDEAAVPPGEAAQQKGWRALKVQGPLDFALTGILWRLLTPLAAAKISIFALSTYDTDYILVKEATLERTLAALRSAGHAID